MLHLPAILLSVFNTLLVPVQFTDREIESTPAQIENLALDCAGYFSSQFRGQTYFSITTSGTVTLDNAVSYYGKDRNSEIDPDIPLLVIEACEKLDRETDFHRFCNKTDSEVDLVIFLVAGLSEADGGGTDFFWPQFSSLSSKGYSLSLDDLAIDNFIICPELSGSGVAGVGTLCHEFAHFLGLPDFYDTDRLGSGGLVQGAFGDLSLMDSGYLVPEGGVLPGFTAVERELTGIGRCLETVPGEYCISSNDEYLRLDGPEEGEYYLIEYNPLSEGDGLQTYYVNKSFKEAGFSEKEGRILTAAQRWELNEINCNPDFQCARKSDGAFLFSGGWQAPLAVTDIRKEDDRLLFNVIESICIKDFRPYQDGAAVRFNVYGDEVLSDCTVEWYQEGEMKAVQTPLAIDGDMVVLLDGMLDPSKECSFLIIIKKQNITQYSLEYRFKTAWWQEGGLPFISFNSSDRNPGGSFIKDSLIPLKVWNLPDQNGTKWYFNGIPVKGGWLKLDRSGTLRAEVNCRDGSTQIIEKKIISE